MNFEFYETPAAFTRWLFYEMADLGHPIYGRLFEPCVGSGAILRAAETGTKQVRWRTNDLDERWPADSHIDARNAFCWPPDAGPDWTVSNPPFTPAIDIIDRALMYSEVGVAMHLRASIHEVLKGRGKGKKRQETRARGMFMTRNPPTGILWLPRFAYQRSKTTGKWTTDSVCACWVVWLKDPAAPQFIRYAPESVLDELAAETPAYRARMDRLMAERAA